MNVFVLCTGRCGSQTFIRACGHADNFTVGHETRARLVGNEKFAYPSNHIEADNRLSWHLGRLGAIFGKDAFYVHLFRNPAAVAESLSHRWAPVGGIMPAYRNGVLRAGAHSRSAIARDLVATVEANITEFLRDKPNVLRAPLEDVSAWFPGFWDRIGATGDRTAAIEEWSRRHNSRTAIPPLRKLRQKLKGIQQVLIDPPLR